MLELNDGLADEQNGFRHGRCAGDHITSLSLIVESNNNNKLLYSHISKKHRQYGILNQTEKRYITFASFIDFSKAYDRIDRLLLWHKLSKNGIDGNMLISLKSLYENVKCTVMVNGVHSS